MIDKKKIGYWEATSIGIGGMVGGGIFAVLGLSVQLTGGASPIAFFLGGVVALFTAYSYARLSVALQNAGGTVYFIDKGFSSSFFTGTMNILLWLSYIIMLSLYATAFGNYFVTFFSASMRPYFLHIAITSIIVFLTILNLFAVKIVGALEDFIVFIKVFILIIFIAFGIWNITPDRLAYHNWSSPTSIFIGGMIIFLAYEGFELIANTAKDIKDPAKALPRAFFTSVLVVILLYVVIAIVTVGCLSMVQIIEAKDYTLAAAAKPTFGNVGFVLITIAALLSTASAINATIYGATRLSYIIATEGELPEILEKKIWNKPIVGLLITSFLTLLSANFINLENLALMGSSGFLLIFAAVNIANTRLSNKTNSYAFISIIGAGLCLCAFLSLIWYTYQTKPIYLLVLAGMILSSASIEAFYEIYLRRKIKLSKDKL